MQLVICFFNVWYIYVKKILKHTAEKHQFWIHDIIVNMNLMKYIFRHNLFKRKELCVVYTATFRPWNEQIVWVLALFFKISMCSEWCNTCMFAAILGFHGMLNQVQYHQAFVEQKDNSEVAGGFQGESTQLESDCTYGFLFISHVYKSHVYKSHVFISHVYKSYMFISHIYKSNVFISRYVMYTKSWCMELFTSSAHYGTLPNLNP